MAALGDAQRQWGLGSRLLGEGFRRLEGASGERRAAGPGPFHRRALAMARYTFQAYVMRAWRQATPFSQVQAAL